MIDRVAIDGAVLGPEILVLPIVILDRDGEADRRETELLERDMVAAAAEAIGAPDLPHVEADRDLVGDAGDEARQVARGRIVEAAAAALGGDQLRRRIGAHAFGEDADVAIVAHPVRAAAVADDVVVEIGLDPPVMILGILREDRAAVEALLLAGDRRVDDRRREAIAREHPRRLQHRGGARAVVIGPRRVGGAVHHVSDAAVDMAGDDDDAVGIGGAALDGDHVLHQARRRDARIGDGIRGSDDLEAAAAGLAMTAELAFRPVERRADAARRIVAHRQGVARAEGDEPLDGCVQPLLRHLVDDLAQARGGRRRRILRGGGDGEKKGGDRGELLSHVG